MLWGLWAWLSHTGRSAEHAVRFVGLAVSHGQVCRTRSGVCGPGCLTWAVSCAWQTKRYRWARIRQWPVRSQQLVQCMTGLDRTMLIQWERVAWVFSPYYGLWSNAALLVKKKKKKKSNLVALVWPMDLYHIGPWFDPLSTNVGLASGLTLQC